ncbi:nucleotidyltransferase domain-containing protein [Microlunatus sp. Gsoil 973]|jgi:predicted nucleotidyltransferase|uniref:nucleotidyltransferase domain-containing protein n=1 Tax=Microlunatus sp. Gsoil 973 TaxID=2672569 RepID=UPI0012B46F51|nr:nucleotidyltransferase domain-containing protein [Microlunatus sp. Gsoil 973]QGN33096.1 nucleotidyltransferase domain-containing protein [Microlunatus sp. Gsoil 973]
MDDARFLDHVADRLAGLPTVEAVALGGSRAQGTARPDSDWDLAVYYRGDFRPDDLRGLGWPGEVSELGGWGGGVFNGGAWLEIDGRRVDVHYRDLADVEHQVSEAEAGRFTVERLMFHVLGIPTYLVVAELALNVTLRGSLARPDYPARLRTDAPRSWWDWAGSTFDYALANHAPAGRTVLALGLAAQAAAASAHAVLAARGIWITNDKRLLGAAGLDHLDRHFTAAVDAPGRLVDLVSEIRDHCAEAVRAVGVC